LLLNLEKNLKGFFHHYISDKHVAVHQRWQSIIFVVFFLLFTFWVVRASFWEYISKRKKIWEKTITKMYTFNNVTQFFPFNRDDKTETNNKPTMHKIATRKSLFFIMFLGITILYWYFCEHNEKRWKKTLKMEARLKVFLCHDLDVLWFIYGKFFRERKEFI
jgi:hypothetical protein